MSGIYIHIPFCKQACHYCDFHFSVSLNNKDAFLKALTKEIYLQRNYFSELQTPNSQLQTIYLGGGTPSLLSSDEIKNILYNLAKNYELGKNPEITLEANPDDLTKEKLASLKEAGVNRLSIGIQSFSNDDLRFMNRAHNSVQAHESVKTAQDAGFSNITIDLIYGTPTLSHEQWLQNLETAFALNVPHLSCYSLTVEPKTALAQFISKGKVPALDETKSAEQFELLMQMAADNSFEQYEISNFAKNKMYSQHNTNYWRNKKYLGLGPSAHSFNGVLRQWNISNNAAYINLLSENKIPFETEVLTITQQYNEYVLTSLRTMWGSDINIIIERFGKSFADQFNKSVVQFIHNGWIEKHEDIFVLTRQGKFFADKVAMELFQA
jgi:oxygen-independent coproporphyrinogen-3 oxidase